MQVFGYVIVDYCHGSTIRMIVPIIAILYSSTFYSFW